MSAQSLFPPQSAVDPDAGVAILSLIGRRNQSLDNDPSAGLTRVGGRLEIHCAIDEHAGRVSDVASVATAFRGYEALLVKRGLRDAGLVSSTASGICGGVHATASSQCLEMALGLRPPPLGIVTRNLLLSCQYLDENPLQLFVFSGPDYSRETLQRTNPALWQRAERSPAARQSVHGYASVGAIMTDLDKGRGKLYLEAMTMVRTAREAYAAIGGKYPHSESIVPGGVTLKPTEDQLDRFLEKLRPFSDYAKRCVAIWDEIFDFLYEANPAYAKVGESPATMVDFGQWDHDEAYDASYAHCDDWGLKRWSTPGAIVDGKLVTTRLTELNCGLEEFVDRSYYERATNPVRFDSDPLGNALSPQHPWNRDFSANAAKLASPAPYTWASTMTWRRRVFEVGAYARIYLSALGGCLPKSAHFHSTGRSLLMHLPADQLAAIDIEWRPPAVWNAFERNRARAYAVAFNLLVLKENAERARRLLRAGASTLVESFEIPTSGQTMGAGFCGAGRGFLAHWAVVRDGAFANYQIAVPSRINAGPRSPWGELGAIERAVMNTPILETRTGPQDALSGIDIVRAIQSFDPCMPCAAHLHMKDGQSIECTIATTGP
ncbi:MAG: nickel-dependent hydrogenase large subunit [Pseudomonadota bacterium]|nr:nickel-dependent hydrogenase large subunit [Pseudomonadota bacterium]